ncbi:hypothetical protein AVEN_5285-1 [Araneus ventricosus]|uniref:Uncharacterized protein n=1 Tax=Araneus ventricosus TaxID=182803 RepID=A0A4Y2CX96_ARAVE|nr:hypothetical protein AVEN_5285-1 [Araneus ventricosus]
MSLENFLEASGLQSGTNVAACWAKREDESKNTSCRIAHSLTCFEAESEGIGARVLVDIEEAFFLCLPDGSLRYPDRPRESHGGDYTERGRRMERDGGSESPRGVHEGAQVVVFPSVERVHIHGGTLHHPDLARICFPLLPEQREERCRGRCESGQNYGSRKRWCAGRRSSSRWKRDWIYDRSERLGRGAHLWAVDDRQNFGKSNPLYT